MKAFLKNYHQSPRKVRLVASLIKGKKVTDALTQLDFINKRATLPIKKLINSAVANAENNFNLKRDDLFVKDLRVDKGMVMKRMIPGARGRGYPFDRRMSHIFVQLDVKLAAEDKPKKQLKIKNEKLKIEDKKTVKTKTVKKAVKTAKK